MDDSELLENELKVNNERIKKLEEHKKSTEIELEKNRPEEEHEILIETMKRIEKNLKIEHEKRNGIRDAISANKKF